MIMDKKVMVISYKRAMVILDKRDANISIKGSVGKGERYVSDKRTMVRSDNRSFFVGKRGNRTKAPN